MTSPSPNSFQAEHFRPKSCFLSKNIYVNKFASFVDSKLLLIGPGNKAGGRSEVLRQPDLTTLDCKLPVFPDKEYNSYVGRPTSDGVHLCGGETSAGFISSCYLLTASGYQDMPALLTKRWDAAAVMTSQGWWVTGIPSV